MTKELLSSHHGWAQFTPPGGGEGVIVIVIEL